MKQVKIFQATEKSTQAAIEEVQEEINTWLRTDGAITSVHFHPTQAETGSAYDGGVSYTVYIVLVEYETAN